MNSIIRFGGCLLLFLALSGCFPHQTAQGTAEPPGFFTGVWHGWIAPISLVVSLFDSDIRIYQTPNSGWWYDFGFYMAVISGFGGLAVTRKDRRYYDSRH